MDYKDAGVDIEAGREFVDRIRGLVNATRRPEVLGGLGGFGGFCELPPGYRHPVLVSGTDGVGTKLKIAQALNCHTTIGIDLVAMCVNDVLTCGAEPLFFLDYLATGKLEPRQLTEVVEGVANGCQQAGCALLGGETAEMPGFYSVGEYDVAGFCVGVVERDNILDGRQVAIGDVIIGIGSTGIHSNGYSLVRRIVESASRPQQAGSGYQLDEVLPELDDRSLGEVLLTPTRIYVHPILEVLKAGRTIHAMAHITGGGLHENLPRCLGSGQAAQLVLESWSQPPIFSWLAKAGNVSPSEMFRTFNMGIGFVVIVPAADADDVVRQLINQQMPAWVIGSVISGEGNVIGLPA